MTFKDKVIVITGASKGLGRALVQAFSKNGAKLVLAARLKSALELLAKDVNGVSVATDIRSEDQVFELAKQAINKFGKIDIWINNAGIWTPHAPIEKLDSKRVHEMIEVNLFGTIYGSKAALTQMKKQKSGVIINIISTVALEGRVGSAGYGASKYAVVGFTKTLRLEAKPEDISVIAVYPGGMKTNFFDERKPDDIDKYMEPSFVAEKIIENLKKHAPEEELIIRRPQA